MANFTNIHNYRILHYNLKMVRERKVTPVECFSLEGKGIVTLSLQGTVLQIYQNWEESRF